MTLLDVLTLGLKRSCFRRRRAFDASAGCILPPAALATAYVWRKTARRPAAKDVLLAGLFLILLSVALVA